VQTSNGDGPATYGETVASHVGQFYERYPYPPPVDNLEAYRRTWNEARRKADSHLFWPSEPYRDDRSILVAGCGTVQAAHYALRWPRARVVGVDVSENSIAFTKNLKDKYTLKNLEVRQLAVERVEELGETFKYVVCTGVLHHLPDPDAGLRALRSVLEPAGAINLMVYAPLGRAGVYMLQEYCKRLSVGSTDREIEDLAVTLRALPADHPIVPLLRSSPDFASRAGLADALLHPLDRAYSVPQLMEFLDRAGLRFGRWMRQAPYLPACGAIRFTPHAEKLSRLNPAQQFAAMELFRGTMVRHTVCAYRNDERLPSDSIDFDSEGWPGYIPMRLGNPVIVRDNLPPGASAVLINRDHTFTDLYLPLDEWEERLLSAADGERSIADICATAHASDRVRCFFRQLWQWDQVVFNTSRSV